MSHTWANGLNGAWYNTYVPQASDYSAIDASFNAAINGDGGSNGAPWTPISANVFVDGAGFWIGRSVWTMQSGATAKTANGAPFTLGDSDYFVYANGHPSRTRTILQSMFGLDQVNSWTPFVDVSLPCGMKATQTGAQLILPLRVHQGSQISTVQFSFAVGQSHSNVPANLPVFRVCKKDGFGNVTPLATSGVDAQGFLAFPTPVSGAAWYSGGAVQTITYTCDAGVVIDKSTYSYFAEIQDEHGAHSLPLNLYISAFATFIDILDNRPS